MAHLNLDSLPFSSRKDNGFGDASRLQFPVSEGSGNLKKMRQREYLQNEVKRGTHSTAWDGWQWI